MKKKYLAVFMGSVANLEKWKAMDEARRKEAEQTGIEAWSRWATSHADAIADSGSPLGKTKRISARGIADAKNEMAAYTIVEAESHEAAAGMFANHPHFTIFPGEAVEVMECLPMPGM